MVQRAAKDQSVNTRRSMNNMENGGLLHYKGYTAQPEYSDEDSIFYGKILGIKDMVYFQSDSAKDIEKEFHEAVDDYLEFCAEVSKEPQKEYSGLFNVRYFGVFEPVGNGAFSVYFPDLPGCTSYGETLGDTQKNAQDALGLHLYGLEQDGDPIPPPLCHSRGRPRNGGGGLGVFGDSKDRQDGDVQALPEPIPGEGT